MGLTEREQQLQQKLDLLEQELGAKTMAMLQQVRSWQNMTCKVLHCMQAMERRHHPSFSFSLSMITRFSQKYIM